VLDGRGEHRRGLVVDGDGVARQVPVFFGVVSTALEREPGGEVEREQLQLLAKPVGGEEVPLHEHGAETLVLGLETQRLVEVAAVDLAPLDQPRAELLLFDARGDGHHAAVLEPHETVHFALRDGEAAPVAPADELRHQAR